MRPAVTQAHAQAKAPGLVISQPGMYGEQAGEYFPNGRVASEAGATSFWSPLSYNGSGPGGDPLDVLTVPRGGESPWIITPPSDEQGMGRSPGQAWPWQAITEAYNFDSLAYVPFEWEQTGPAEIPGGWGDSTDGRTGPERMKRAPMSFEQYEGYATNPDSVAVLQDPAQAAYTIGWGSLDDPGGDQHGYEAYGE